MNWRNWIVSFLIILAALVVYAFTLTPSLSYLSPDGSELATVPAVLGLAHPPGYPLYTWLGFLFSLMPVGDVAYRINLMSAVMGALATGGLYLIIIQLLPKGLSSLWRRVVSALSALLFAFSLTFWSQAVIAEVYVPNLALVVLAMLALLRWERSQRGLDFFWFALLYGLSLGTHISNLGFAPAFVLFVLLVIFEKQQTVRRGRLKSILLVAALGLIGFALGTAQYVWLPVRAGMLGQRAVLGESPTTLMGFYNYTLNAFPQFKFAYPLTALPDRLVIYLDLLRQQFGLAGIGAGIVGLFSLLFRRRQHYFLLVGMYLVQVWFFIQYRAFDLDVFFIPAHMIWVIFLAFGMYEILLALSALLDRLMVRSNPFTKRVLTPFLVVAVLALSLVPLSQNWDKNDFSQDTAINDFYANLWTLLPQSAALMTQGGVAGYDAFYWQMVYDTRSDVFLPVSPENVPGLYNLVGREIYSTTRTNESGRDPLVLPPGFVGGDLWAVPVLLGQQAEASAFFRRELLVLYRLSETPPELVVADAEPQIRIDADLGPVNLLGVDLSSRQVESGAAIQIGLYWRLEQQSPMRVEVMLGELSLEQHEIGFGLLQRYAQTRGLQPGSVVVDRYWLVIPSSLAAGKQALTIQTIGLQGQRGNALVLADIDVINQIGTMQRWLQIAKQ